MFSKLVSATAVALATTSLVSAQTFSACNPVKGDKCPADPALGTSLTVDFTQGESDFFEVAGGTTLTYDGSNGAVFTINKDTDAPTITSKKYIMFGKVDVVLQASAGIGVVTSVVLQSDCLDEIDWEWLGGDATQVQTNYFSKGDTSTYDRGGYSPVSNPQGSFHKYTIEWTKDAINWMIDDTVVRTLTYAAAKGGASFPQTPMQLKLGTWVAGRKGAPEGTIQWAGGLTDFSAAPFKGFYKSVTITDYSNGVKGASSYVYGDTSGTYGSIQVNTGGDADSASSTKGSKSKTASSTATTLSAVKPTGLANAASNVTSTGTGSLPTPTGSSTGGSSTPTPISPNAGIQTAANFIAMGAALFLSYLVL